MLLIPRCFLFANTLNSTDRKVTLDLSVPALEFVLFAYLYAFVDNIYVLIETPNCFGRRENINSTIRVSCSIICCFFT